MLCRHCQQTIADESAYCPACGHAQQAATDVPPVSQRRLTRAPDGKVAGVCAGLADYLDVDVTFVRVVWVVLSIVPGALIGGVLAYLGAWLVMPERDNGGTVRGSSRRLTRSVTDRKIAGVCGGLARYFDVDPTPLRVLWIVLTVVPGAIVFGVVAYLVAWIMMPRESAATSTLQSAPTPL